MNREIVLARSKAGHDKNHVYLIWAQDAEYLYLVNGTTKRLSAPKKKEADARTADQEDPTRSQRVPGGAEHARG